MNANPLEPKTDVAEVVAYNLLLHVMSAEGRPLGGDNSGTAKLSRNLILDAYADCLEAVRGERTSRVRRGVRPE